MTIGETIKKLRKEQELTQTELGKILGVEKSTISMYENNKSRPDDSIKLKLANFFGVSIDYLLGISDNPHKLEEFKMDDSLKSIRYRIHLKKTELGLSYEDLSKRTGLSKSTLQRYVTGDIGNLGLDKLEILAKALNCSPSYLMGWSDKNNNSELDEDLHIIQRIRNSLSEYDKGKMNDMLNIIITSFKDQIENLESDEIPF